MPDPTNLNVQQVNTDGIVPSYAAADANGNTFTNSGRAILHIKNGSGAPITATVNSLVNCNQGHDHDIAVVVSNGAEKMLGPFPQARFNNATTGKASVAYSAAADVTVAVVEVP